MDVTTFMQQQFRDNPAALQWPPGMSDGKAEEFRNACTAKWKEAAGTRGHIGYLKKHAILAFKMFGLEAPNSASFAALPEGYVLWMAVRDEKRQDYYLMGHPSGQEYRSVVEAWPHFQHVLLSDPDDRTACVCRLCTKVPKKTSTTPRRIINNTPGGPKGGDRMTQNGRVALIGEQPPRHTASELPLKGVEYAKASGQFVADFQELLGEGDSVESNQPTLGNGLAQGTHKHIHGSAARLLVDTASQAAFDAQHHFKLPPVVIEQYRNDIASHIDYIKTLPSVYPRIGETVLYTEDFKVVYDELTNTHKAEMAPGKYIKVKWEVGLVTSIHIADDLEDILDTKIKVDRLAEGDDARLEQATFVVSLKNVRPLTMIAEMLGSNDAVIGESVHAAQLVYGRLALCGPVSSSKLYNNGMVLQLDTSSLWIGAELLLRGDAIRLFTRENDPAITRIMIIAGFCLQFRFVKGQWSRGRVIVYGTGFDSHPSAATREDPFTHGPSLPTVMHAARKEDKEWLGTNWYAFRHADSPEDESPSMFSAEAHNIVGRLHEAREVERYSGLKHFSYRTMIRNFRAGQAALNDKRGAGRGLLLGQNRASTLGIYYFDKKLIGPGLHHFTKTTFPWGVRDRSYWTADQLHKDAEGTREKLVDQPLMSAQEVSAIVAKNAALATGSEDVEMNGGEASSSTHEIRSSIAPNPNERNQIVSEFAGFVADAAKDSDHYENQMSGVENGQQSTDQPVNGDKGKGRAANQDSGLRHAFVEDDEEMAD